MEYRLGSHVAYIEQSPIPWHKGKVGATLDLVPGEILRSRQA